MDIATPQNRDEMERWFRSRFQGVPIKDKDMDKLFGIYFKAMEGDVYGKVEKWHGRKEWEREGRGSI